MSSIDTTQAEELKQQARRYLADKNNPRLQPLAIAWFQRALALEPGDTQLLLELGAAYRLLGNQQAAIACTEQALELAPNSLEALVRLAFRQIPLIHFSAASVTESRRRYHAALLRLVAAVDAASHEQLGEAAQGAITAGMPGVLTLTSQGYDVREVQELYGGILCKVMAAAYPEWAAPEPPEPPVGRRIRVGIVSPNFRNYSHWRMLIEGWVGKLDPARFELFCFALGDPAPELMDFAVERGAKVTTGLRQFEQWCAAVRGARLDALIYPELGDNAVQQRMAALRLAPAQCVAWGNPITSGLPTIDYFLSSDLAEPPDAAKHYTEQLIRLPNLATFIEPTVWEASDEPRAAFGLRDGAVVFLCAQYLLKYLPQHDFIFTRIAAALPDCQFVFSSRSCPPASARQFEQRLAQAFAAAGLDAARYLVVLSAPSNSSYRRMTELCDVFLDNIGYTGFTTTIEAALAPGLPIVTHGGELMRGRLSLAILRRIGVEELITTSSEGFIELAVRLGRDKIYRSAIAARIAANKSKVYEDIAAIDGLQSFLQQVVAGLSAPKRINALTVQDQVGQI